MGSRTRGDGIIALDTVLPRYQSAKLVSGPASGRDLHVSKMCRTEGDPGASLLGMSPCSGTLGPAHQSLGKHTRKLCHLLGWLEYCVNRSVPRLSPRVTAMLVARYPDEIDQFATAWKTIWEVAGTVIITMLWQHRVDNMSRHENIPMQASEALIWGRIQRQLRALIKRFHCRADTAVRGAQLSACYDIFISEPRGPPGLYSQAASRGQCLDSPGLLVWLTTYQRSCTNQ
ncbi:unnamed protein product [Peronospora belbahrii]|uniref:Uncharacterized protein n=1 Tax=Peronospora belbahrii TaxID=622444 RepID=A0ABN8CX21_9STRA|nr:unnamed protein product [Peronospora belbahrii]